MARRSKTPSPPPKPNRLRVPRQVAAEKVQVQISEGEELLAENPSTKPALDALHERRRIWSDYNRELLTQLFTSAAVAEEYAHVGPVGISMHPSFSDLIRYWRDSVQSSLTRLRSIHRRLDLIPEVEGAAPKSPVAERPGSDVFVVHGHNNEVKETVARFLEKLGLKVTILHELPDEGRTIIEKFEQSANVGYAVVLLTSDDVGAARTASEHLQARARQNVILELGYFLGRLGRTHVCALRQDDVEVPSDLAGVLYVPLDPARAWKLTLAREMKTAGLDIDLNLAV